MSSKRSFFAIAFGACCIAGFATTTPVVRKYLINARNSSPILQIATPRAGAGASCSAKELRLTMIPGSPMRAQSCEGGACTPADPNSFAFNDRTGRASSSSLRLGTGDPSAGPVEPVEGPGDLKWLCRNDEEGKQCICIPWFPPAQ